MNERIRQLRNTLKLNQEKFGECLGIGKTAISKIEKGENNLSEQNIIIICDKFNVNEEWLRTGNGEMFIQLSRDEEIADFVGKLLSTESDDFKHRLIGILSQLDESGWEALEQTALNFSQLFSQRDENKKDR